MSKNLDVNVNYTYTKNDDEAIRIPKFKTNLGLAYRMTKKTNFSVDYQFVSDRDDTDFRDFLNIKNVTLESYALLDFGRHTNSQKRLPCTQYHQHTQRELPRDFWFLQR